MDDFQLKLITKIEDRISELASLIVYPNRTDPYGYKGSKDELENLLTYIKKEKKEETQD